MKLEIAAGDNPQKTGLAWVHHDIRMFPCIEYCMSWKELGRQTERWSELYCRHFIEHLDPIEALEFLMMCRRILDPGGTLTVECPNMKWLCEKYVRGEYADPSEVVCWLFGGGDFADWSYHRSGWDCDILCGAMKHAGFQVASVTSDVFLLSVTGRKGYEAT